MKAQREFTINGVTYHAGDEVDLSLFEGEVVSQLLQSGRVASDTPVAVQAAPQPVKRAARPK